MSVSEGLLLVDELHKLEEEFRKIGQMHYPYPRRHHELFEQITSIRKLLGENQK